MAAALALVAPGTALATYEATLTLSIADDDLRDRLAAASLVLAAEEDEETSSQDILAAARADYGRLVGALYAAGRYGPVVRILVDGREAAAIPPLQAPTQVRQVRILVEPGRVFTFGEAVVTPLAPGTELPDGFAAGRPAPSDVIEKAARAGVEGWRQAGNAKAAIAAQDIAADHSDATLDARITLAPGPRVTFGKLVITSPSAVRDRRIAKIAGLPTGEVFDPDALDAAASRLRRTGTFRSVVLRESETLGPGNTMDVELTVVDEKPRRFGAGAEVSTTEGLSLTAFWLHRNLLGGAERLRIDGAATGLGGQDGGPDYRLGLSYSRPATVGANTDLYVLGEIEQLDEPLFFSKQINTEIGLKRIYSDVLSAELGLAFRYADVRDQLGSRSFTHLSLPVRLTWDRRDDQLDPADGFFLQGSVMPYLGFSGSESGGRMTLDGRAYQGFGADDRFVLAARVQLGSIVGSGLAGTPPDLLFYSGGGGTVRGQPYQSLAVTTAGGARTGGRSFLGLSGEVRADVTRKIGLVGFYDAGFIGEGSVPGKDAEWQAGAGLGLRYNTGIGPIRLDVAAPVRGNTGDGVQIYVGIGQAF